jgi:hypothetical protein
MAAHTRRTGGFLLFAGSLIPAIASSQGARQQPPVITAFTINAGADSVSATDVAVSLTHTVVGAPPSEYRVSRRADFAGARWIPYVVPLTIRDWYDDSGIACRTTRLSHRVTLYLQVRANVGEEVRIVDGQRQLVPASVESNVLRATICAHVPGETPEFVDTQSSAWLSLTPDAVEGYSVFHDPAADSCSGLVHARGDSG